MNHRQATTLWCQIIVEELVRQGAKFFCISPGSRSTPLTIAVARNPKASYSLFPDERAAAFFALGHARATGMPALLVCTSGTAVANYFPAIVEASADSIPMIVLSADRPFELLETGANQTIRQHGLFGSYTRWNFQLPSPGTDTPPKALLSTIDHAVRRSLDSPAGPVHLNLPFREPLEPEAPDITDPWATSIAEWYERTEPWSRHSPRSGVPSSAELSELSTILSRSRLPLLVAGKMASIEDALGVAALARKYRLPLYADLTSGLRLSDGVLPWQLPLRSERFNDRFRPDTVIHFGGTLIGRQLIMAIRQWSPKHIVVVRNHPERLSPDHNVTLTIEASPSAVCRGLPECNASWDIPDFRDMFDKIASLVDRETCTPEHPVNEISAARILSSLVTKQQGLFISNSMPARDADMFASPGTDGPVPTGLNRGASGIDGIIATAAGYSNGLGKPVTLLIGDIAFLHDLNSLSLLDRCRNRLIIVVVNNGGGGIFSFLPVSAESDVFEECFATPQTYDISLAARTFGLGHLCPATNRELSKAWQKAAAHDRSTIIEIRTTHTENLSLHRALGEKINAITTSYA